MPPHQGALLALKIHCIPLVQNLIMDYLDITNYYLITCNLMGLQALLKQHNLGYCCHTVRKMVHSPLACVADHIVRADSPLGQINSNQSVEELFKIFNQLERKLNRLKGLFDYHDRLTRVPTTCFKPYFCMNYSPIFSMSSIMNKVKLTNNSDRTPLRIHRI